MAETINFPAPDKRSELKQPKSQVCYLCSGLGEVLIDGNRYAICHICNGEGVTK